MSSPSPSATAPQAAPEAADAIQASAPAPTHTGVDGRGILITEPAMRQLASLMQQQGDDKVLRVGVRSGGCSGMSYTMDFIDAGAIRDDDEIYTYEPEGAPCFRVVSPDRWRLQLHQSQCQPDLRLRQLLRRLRPGRATAPWESEDHFAHPPQP